VSAAVSLLLTLAAGPRIGDAAPALSLRALDGAAVELAALRGGPVVVEFFASWCEPCRRGLEDLRAIRADLGERMRVLVVAVDRPDRVRAFFAAAAPPDGAKVVLDPEGESMRRWGTDRLPTTFFVDGAGVVRHINRGHGAGFRARATQWLRPMVAR